MLSSSSDSVPPSSAFFPSTVLGSSSSRSSSERDARVITGSARHGMSLVVTPFHDKCTDCTSCIRMVITTDQKHMASMKYHFIHTDCTYADTMCFVYTKNLQIIIFLRCFQRTEKRYLVICHWIQTAVLTQLVISPTGLSLISNYPLRNSLWGLPLLTLLSCFATHPPSHTPTFPNPLIPSTQNSPNPLIPPIYISHPSILPFSASARNCSNTSRFQLRREDLPTQ